jgi:hypothetical protein
MLGNELATLDFLMNVLAKNWLLMGSLDTPSEYYVQCPESPQTSVPLHPLLPSMVKPTHLKTFP